MWNIKHKNNISNMLFIIKPIQDCKKIYYISVIWPHSVYLIM